LISQLVSSMSRLLRLIQHQYFFVGTRRARWQPYLGERFIIVHSTMNTLVLNRLLPHSHIHSRRQWRHWRSADVTERRVWSVAGDRERQRWLLPTTVNDSVHLRRTKSSTTLPVHCALRLLGWPTNSTSVSRSDVLHHLISYEPVPSTSVGAPSIMTGRFFSTTVIVKILCNL